MKKVKFLIMVVLIGSFSCTEDQLFEKDTWWYGHWENMDDPAFFFSVGQKPAGINKIRTTQFFISTYDSIYTNFYVKEIIEYNYKNKYKVIKTNEGTYLKIQEIEEENYIDVYGPSSSMEEMESKKVSYKMMLESTEPPFSDSILFVN